jgi:hypothetical protein
LNPGKYESVQEYIANCENIYQIPLESFFKENSPNGSMKNWRDKTLPLNIISHDDLGFEWPKTVAYCMPSVKSRFQRNVPHPRSFAMADTNLKQDIDGFHERSKDFYEKMEKLNISQKKQILRRKVLSNGEEEKYSSMVTKRLDERIIQCNTAYITILYRELEPENKLFVLDLLNNYLRDEEEKNQIVAKFTDNKRIEHTLKLHDIRQFKIGKSIQIEVLEYFIHLCNYDDELICSGHKDVNANKSHYQARKLSKFCSTSFMKNLQQKAGIVSNQDLNSFGDIACLSKIYIPIPPNDSKKHWTLFVIDVEQSVIICYDPNKSIQEEILRDAEVLALLLKKISINWIN